MAFTKEFLEDAAKKVQWKAFIGRIGMVGDQPSLAEIGRFLARFLLPAITAAAGGPAGERRWRPPGPWE